MVQFLANEYVQILGIPLAFLVCGVLAKILSRGTGGAKLEDVYLGVEATLATLSAALIHITDLAQRKNFVPASMTITTMFIAFTFACLLLLIALRRAYTDSKYRTVEVLLLAIGSNIIGIGSLVAFIIWVKRA